MSNSAASPYIPLIMLTRANIKGQPSSPNLTGQGGSGIQGTGAQANVASNVSSNPAKDKKRFITLPAAGGGSSSSQAPSEASISGGDGGSIPPSTKVNTLNSFMTKMLFKELENV